MKSRFAKGCGCFAVLVAAFVVLGLIGIMLGFGDEPDPMPTVEVTAAEDTLVDETTVEVDEDLVTFLSVVDGDTIRTSEGTVRIMGIDTPEQGECGYREASSAIENLFSNGDPIMLVLPKGQNDQDKYDRLLRYVFTENGVDIGRMQLEAGLAVARYDSSDGYPEHPQEHEYRSAQTALLNSAGKVITEACQELVAEATTPPTSENLPGDAWWHQYRSCNQLKKNDVGHPTGPFNHDDPAEADIYDWFAYGTGYNGDGDWDGLACE